MTCREKLKIEHPKLVSSKCAGGCSGCPHHYGYLERPYYCPYNKGYTCEPLVPKCTECWDREIEEEITTKDDSKTIMDIVINAMKMKNMRIDLYFGDSGITCNIYPYNKN